MKIIRCLLVSITTLFSTLLFSQKSSLMTTKGTLLIMGGDCTNDFFISKFAGLVGGLNRTIVIIPTAMEEHYIDSETDLEFLKKPFTDVGFTHINIVHTRKMEIANGDSLNDLLLAADGVWITGGRQWRLAKAYNGTKIQASLKTLLNQGKVIAGTSAGASIMADVLVRGDSTNATTMLGAYQNGFGFISNFAIDQHHIARNRQFDMFELKHEKPDILGIGIDENTGVILSENTFRVIGDSYVIVYDNTRWSEERDTIYSLNKNDKQFYTLSNGYAYDLLKRKTVAKNDREAATVDEHLIKQITGVYLQTESLEQGNNLQITITWENEVLYFEQSWNKAKYAVEYLHLTTFFRPNSISAYHFNRDKKGAIHAFDFFQYAYGISNWVKQ